MTRLINKADEGELLKPWHRVHFNKDGSVQSCERVDGAKNERGGYVQYVQADSKEEAIAIAKAKLEKYEARAKRQRESKADLRGRLRTSGRCFNCKQPSGGRARCPVCEEAYNARRGELRKGLPMRKAPVAKTEEERIAAQLRIEAQNRASNAARRERQKEVLGGSAAAKAAYANVKFARAALAEYDRLAAQSRDAMPAFRGWLVRQVASLEAQITRCSAYGNAAAAE